MADAIIPGLDASALMGGLDGVTTAILWIMGIALVGFLAWVIQFYLSFKIDCVIEEMVNGTATVRNDKIRQYKEKGVPKWQVWGSLFRFKKDKIAIPKDVFIKLRPNGRKFVTLFKTPTGDYLNVKNSVDLINNIAQYDEFTTQQRQMIIQEYREAMAYKPTDWTQHIPALAGLTALVIILTVFMLFFNDSVQPMVQIGNQYVAMSQENAKIQGQQGETIRLLAQVLENIDPAYMQQLKLQAQLNASGSNTSAYVQPPN